MHAIYATFAYHDDLRPKAKIEFQLESRFPWYSLALVAYPPSKSNQVSDGGGLIKKSISTKSSQRVAKENKKDVSLGRAHSNVCLLPRVIKKQQPVDSKIARKNLKIQFSISFLGLSD